MTTATTSFNGSVLVQKFLVRDQNRSNFAGSSSMDSCIEFDFFSLNFSLNFTFLRVQNSEALPVWNLYRKQVFIRPRGCRHGGPIKYPHENTSYTTVIWLRAVWGGPCLSTYIADRHVSLERSATKIPVLIFPSTSPYSPSPTFPPSAKKKLRVNKNFSFLKEMRQSEFF